MGEKSYTELQSRLKGKVLIGQTHEVVANVESGDGLPQELCILCRAQLDLSVTFKRQVQKADSMLHHHLAKQHLQNETNDELEGAITGDPLTAERVGHAIEEGETKDSLVNEQTKEIKSESSEELVDVITADPFPLSGEGTENIVEDDNTQDSDVKEEVIVKVEDTFIVAEPWPVTESREENGLPSDSEEDFEEKEIKEENNPSSPSVDTNIDSEEDEDKDALSLMKLDLTCTDRIMCCCDFCSENNELTVLESEDSRDNQLECMLCLKTFGTIKLLKRHQQVHGVSLFEEKFRCVQCSRSFSSRKGLHAHQRQHTSRQPVERTKIIKPVEQSSPTEPSEQPESIRRSTRPSRAPERHVVPHYSCSKCERMYSDQSALENHEKSHLGKPTLKCNHCGKKFYTKDFLEKHIQNAHICKSRNKDRLLHCNVCGKICENRSHLFSHMKSHKSTVHLCEVCGKVVSLNAYPAHKRSHLNTDSEQVFQCDICQKKFTNKVSLRTHKNSYHGPLKYTCEVCGKQFTTMALMKHHQHVHSGKRDHVCQVCGRAFTLKITLKSHMRIHTGEMPYKCDNCGRQFTWKTTYRNHVPSCKTNQNNLDFKPIEIPHFNAVSLNLPQELPIDFSEEGRSAVPIDYSEETRYKHIPAIENKRFPIVLHLNEELKYAAQQSLNYVTDIKPYSRDIKYPV